MVIKKLLDYIIFILWNFCDGVMRVEKGVFQIRVGNFFFGCFMKNIDLIFRFCDRKKIEKCV